MHNRHESNEFDLENPPEDRNIRMLLHRDEEDKEIGIAHPDGFDSDDDSDNDLEMNRDRNRITPPVSDPVEPDDIYTIQRQIQEAKTALENELRFISKRIQNKYYTTYSALSIFIAWTMWLWSREKDMEYGGIAVGCQGILVPLFCLFTNPPFYKVSCFKFPRLNRVLPAEENRIITSMRYANFYFPAIPTVNVNEDSAVVLRKLNIAIKEIDQEMKVNAKKRGDEVLNALKNVGVFSRNFGPVQKTILEYMIHDESIIKSLAVPPPTITRS